MLQWFNRQKHLGHKPAGRLKAITANLMRDRGGNFAIMTAFLAVPVLGTMGMALDYNHAVMRRSELQQALDAAVLTAASTKETATEKMNAEAKAVLAGNLKGDMVETTTPSDLVFTDDGRVTMSATARIPLTLGSILFRNGIEVSALATAVRPVANKLEIAMALDNTWSMNGDKLANLKLAANALLDTFSKSKQENVRFALVPFAQYVNVGKDQRGKSWLDVADDYSVTKESCSMKEPVIGKTNCRTVEQTTTSTRDGITTTTTKMVEKCDDVKGPKQEICTTSTTKYTWNGCVGSRNPPLDVTDSDPGTPYPGLVNKSCNAVIVPLTDNYTTLRNAIKKMTANNETYVPAGILWAWNLLSPQEPFTEADAFGGGTQKYMIVMTDGENTKSPKMDAKKPTDYTNYKYHDGTDTAKANALMSQVCTNAKRQGITIFTVAVGIAGTSTDEMLASCASDSKKAISVDDSDTLVQIFAEIGDQIMTPRLTQ